MSERLDHIGIRPSLTAVIIPVRDAVRQQGMIVTTKARLAKSSFQFSPFRSEIELILILFFQIIVRSSRTDSNFRFVIRILLEIVKLAEVKIL